MNNLELKECELLEIQQHNAERELFDIEQHNQDLQEIETSIRQAVKDFGLDKFSRDSLEYEHAKHLLELDDLVDRLNLLSSYQTKNILDALGFFGGKPTGILRVAMERGAKLQKSAFAVENANKGVAKDPRQQDKKFVKECWEKWQDSLESYISKTAFANDMLDKCEHLKSQKVITDWCRDWEKEMKNRIQLAGRASS